MNESVKSAFISRWKHYFPGAPLPVALFYSNELHAAESAEHSARHHCIIADISRVFSGRSLAFNAENIGCTGGKRYCGFTDTLRPEFEYFLSYGIEGKLEGERYKKDPETVLELLKNGPSMKAPALWLIAKPFEKLDDDDNPEVILFLRPLTLLPACSPWPISTGSIFMVLKLLLVQAVVLLSNIRCWKIQEKIRIAFWECSIHRPGLTFSPEHFLLPFR